MGVWRGEWMGGKKDMEWMQEWMKGRDDEGRRVEWRGEV